MPHGRIAFLMAIVLLGLPSFRVAAQNELNFQVHRLAAESEFSAAAAIDVDKDGQLDIVSGAFWYRAPTWVRNHLRDVERIGNRYDDYSNLPLDVDGDGDLDIVSVNYRSKSLYWVRNEGIEGVPWPKVEIDRPGSSESGRLVDLDSDGRLDILPNGTTFAAWYRNIGSSEKLSNALGKNERAESSTHFVRIELPEQLAGHGVGTGDLNGDGRIDIVGPTGWAESPARPTLDRWIWHPDFRLARDASVPILVWDVDADGDNDLVWGRAHNVGVYWTEHRAVTANHGNDSGDDSIDPVLRSALLGEGEWVTHAIDTSWSCLHAPILGDLDGDGRMELIAGKRYQGHDGKDPGENDPLVIYSYQFEPQTRTWLRRTISDDKHCGIDLDPKCMDIDQDGDMDILAPSRAGLCLLENKRRNSGTEPSAKTRSERTLPDYPNHLDLKHWLDEKPSGGFVKREIASTVDFGNRQFDIRKHMERVMGELPKPSQRVPLNVKIRSIETHSNYFRIQLDFASDASLRVPAYLLVPQKMPKPVPGMLCLHQTNFQFGKGETLGIGGNPNLAYAHELAQRGFICLAPDYPGFVDHKIDFKTDTKHYASGTMKAIWDNIRCLDLLESLPQVAPDQIGCIGHSLGGHNTLFTAAFDNRIRCVVSSCGFNSFEDYYGGKLKGWTSDRYMPRIETLFHSDPKQVPFDFPEILGLIAPRGLFVNAPLHDSNFDVQGVKKCEVAVTPIYELYGKAQNAVFRYPDAQHDFPEPLRQEAYVWLEKQFR